jgi:serine/threonine protein kinase
VFGQYQVTGVLGKGGMGVVYAAEHVLLDRPAAVKVLHSRLLVDQEAVTRFFNEARAATAIRHPGIVEIYDFGRTDDGAAFIVMEHLQGETLRARLDRGPMGWSTSLGLVRQIAGALDAAHAKGIVHRDLKPENIFLVPDPEVPGGERIKLLDFGVAKLAGSAPGQNMTRAGTVIGTPTYMAPEQCRGVTIDARVDLYSLGCILFELCTGRPPFVYEAYGDLLIAHIQEPPPAISSLTSSVPQEIEALIQRMLAKAPADRVQTADELIRLIDTSKIAIKQIARAGRYPVLARKVSLVDVLASYDGLHPADRAADRKPAEEDAPPRRELWPERYPRQGAAELALAIHTQERPAKRRTPARPIASQPDTLESAVVTRPQTATRAPKRQLAALGGVGALAVVLTLVLLGAGGDAPPRTAAAAPNAEASSLPPQTETLPLADKVMISVQSEPRGAELYRGDVYVGRTPQDVMIERGDDEIRFELRLAGHRSQELVVRPTGAIRKSVKLDPVTP